MPRFPFPASTNRRCASVLSKSANPKAQARHAAARHEAEMSVVIYHNPDCGTSRNTLALIQHFGLAPQVVEYLKTPPTRSELADLIARAGLNVRAVLRKKGTPYAELGLDDPGLSDGDL